MIYPFFPGGRALCLTFSYDDGNNCDRRLADIFSNYKLKGTFNINAGSMNWDGKIHGNELREVFCDRGHEVACHGYEHPFFEKMPHQAVVEDIRRDRMELEDAIGEPVRGLAYPYGTYSEDVKRTLKSQGIVYGRTVKPMNTTAYFPEDFMEWHPTCHHKEVTPEKAETFLNTPAWYGPHMYYVWGHAFEFDMNKNWELIEEFCKIVSGHEDKVWYATNIEIYDYLTAYSNLIYTARMDKVYNPGLIPVWIRQPSGGAVEIPSGATVAIQ